MASEKRPSPFMRFIRGLFLLLDLVAVTGLAVSAYSGMVSPLKHGGLWGILPLCLEPCILICLMLMIVQIFWHWRGVILLALGFLACAGPCLEIFPLNVHIGARKAPEGSSELTITTYNVFSFLDQQNTETDRNLTLDYIISCGSDLVCLQEAEWLGISANRKITAAQMEQLQSVYPEILRGGVGQIVLSKHPVTPIHIVTNQEEFTGADLNAFRLHLPGGRIISVFNIHLQSFMLTGDDRELYRELTDLPKETLQKETLHEVKNQLIDKLSKANVDRARQVQALLRFIRHYGGPDVVVCGDFNDVSTCYAIRTLEDAGFSEVHSTIGFGPIITYNASRFYFGIDHVLYKGDITPLSISRGNVRTSDHYPVTVRLAVK